MMVCLVSGAELGAETGKMQRILAFKEIQSLLHIFLLLLSVYWILSGNAPVVLGVCPEVDNSDVSILVTKTWLTLLIYRMMQNCFFISTMSDFWINDSKYASWVTGYCTRLQGETVHLFWAWIIVYFT